MPSNYIISVKLDDGSLARARQQLLDLSKLAGGTVNVPIAAATRAQAAQQFPAQRSVAGAGNQARELQVLQSQLDRVSSSTTKNILTQQAFSRQTQLSGIATKNFAERVAAGEVVFSEIGQQVATAAIKFSTWTAAAALIGATVGVFASVAQSVLSVNDAMIGLQRVTSNLSGTFDRGLATKSFAQDIRELHVSADDAATAAFEMGKAYGDLPQALAASRTVLLANKVAEIDLASASQQLVQVSQAFNLTGFQQGEILDRLNAQQNTLGVNIGKTLEATARSSQITKSAGGDINNLIARTAVGIRFSGFNAETVGRAQSRIAQQILSAGGRKKITDAIQATGNIDLSKALIGDDGLVVQNIDKVFNTLGQHFQQLSAQQKNAIAEAFTNGRQGGLSVIIGSLLENFQLVDKQAGVAANSQGSSFKELQTVLSGTREQVKGIGAEFGVMATNIEKSGLLDVFGGMLATLRQVLKTINDVTGAINHITPGPLQTLLGPAAGAVGVAALANRFNGQGIRGNISNAFTSSGPSAKAVTFADAELKKLAAPIATDVAELGRLAQSAARADIAISRFSELATKAGFTQAQAATAFESALVQRQQGLIRQQGQAGFTRASREAAALGLASPIDAQRNGPEAQRAAKTLASLRGLETSAIAASTAEGRKAKTTVGAAEAEARFISQTTLAAAASQEFGTAMRGLVLSAEALTAAEREQAIAGAAATGSRLGGIGKGIGGFAGSPGGIILGSVGLGVGAEVLNRQAAKKNDVSVLGNVLSTAGTGAAIGSLIPGIGTALGATIGAGAGAAAGLTTGLIERDEKAKELLQDSTNSIKEIVAEHDRLNEAIKVNNVNVVQNAGESDVKAFEEKIKSQRSGIIEGIIANDRSLLQGVPKHLDDDLKQKFESNSVKNPDTGVDTGGSKVIQEQVQRILKNREKFDKFTKDLSDQEKQRLETIRTLSSTSKGDQAQRRNLAGAIDADLRNIELSFSQGNNDQTARLLRKASTGSTALSEFLRATLSKTDFDKFQTAKGKNVAELVNLVTRSRGIARGVQDDAKSIQAAVAQTIVADPFASADDLATAEELAGKALADRAQSAILALSAGVSSRAKTETQLTTLLTQATTALRANPNDDKAQADFVAIQQALDGIRQKRIQEIQDSVSTGTVSPGQGAKQSVAVNANALIQQAKAGGDIARQSEQFKETQAELAKSLSDVSEQQRAAVDKRFDALLASAKTDAQKSALLRQKSAQIKQAGLVTLAAAGLTTGSIQELAIATASASQSQVIAANTLVLTLAQYAQAQLQGFTAIAQAGDGLLGQLGNLIGVESLGNGIIAGALGKLQGVLGGIVQGAQGGKDKGVKDAITSLTNSTAQVGKIPTADAATQAANEAAKKSTDAAQTAEDLLHARFDFLKALARGNDVKVAQLGVQEAQQALGFAKTAADRFRAKAAIINAQKDLRSTILQDREGEVDFQLQTEQITQSVAIQRLQALLPLTKGNRQARRDLLLKIFSLSKQENERTFGLPTTFALPSLFQVRQSIAAGTKAGSRTATAHARFAGQGLGAGTVVNNSNSINITVQNANDLKAVEAIMQQSTGATIKSAKFVGRAGLVR